MTDAVCRGCGAPLQSAQPEASGYVPASALNRDQPLCRRCFRIRHYGEFTRVAVTPDDYRREVSRIADDPGVVLYVLDVFDLAGSLVDGLARYVLNSPVVVAVNKVDLLPAEVDAAALEDWIREKVEATGVFVNAVNFVSAETGEGVTSLTDHLLSYWRERIYVVGMANVGKSTLLNRLLAQFGVKDVFTVSRLPGTTLGLSGFKADVSGTPITFIDTPGLLHGDRVIDLLCGDCLKLALPAKRLRPRIFQLNPQQTLWLGGIARFDFKSGVRQPVVCYVSNDLPIHRTKLERADEIFQQHANDILKVPCESCRARLADFHRYGIQAPTPQGRRQSYTLYVPRRGGDIVIPGLGWITLFGEPLQGELLAPRQIEVSLRRRLVGDVSRSRA